MQFFPNPQNYQILTKQRGMWLKEYVQNVLEEDKMIFFQSELLIKVFHVEKVMFSKFQLVMLVIL